MGGTPVFSPKYGCTINGTINNWIRLQRQSERIKVNQLSKYQQWNNITTTASNITRYLYVYIWGYLYIA